MSTVTFDTLKFVKKLESSGIATQQTEAIASAQSEAFEELTKTKDIATKNDLLELKFDLLKWIIGLALGQVAILIGILMKLH